MRYPPYFVVLIFSCIIIAIIFSTINNDLIKDTSSNNQQLIQDLKHTLQNINFSEINNISKNKKEKEKEDKNWKKIREGEKNMNQRLIERTKMIIDEEIEQIVDRKEENKNIEKKKKEEDDKKKEERRRRKEIDERKKRQQERREIIRKERQKRYEDEIKRREKERDKREKILINDFLKEEDKNLINEKEESEKIKKEKEQIKIDESIINEINMEKLRISCAYATDNGYVYPTLVAMTSLCENAGKKTFYDIYVMINPEFSQQNKIVLKSVQTKHPEHCEVIFIDMGNKFKDEKTNKKITTPAYYRLELHNLLPNVDRIIWMDGDTAVFEDLTELITLDMKGNYIMGFLDSIPEAIERFNIENATVLCSGVLLMDLDALRKNNMTEKFNKFMIEEREKINQHDQTVINVVCQKKIAPLPPKYGIWCFEAEKYALKHNERQRPHLRYNTDEFLKAYYHPAILHYVWPKPFWRRKKPIFNKQWWEYARISGYYKDILNISPKYTKRFLLQRFQRSQIF